MKKLIASLSAIILFSSVIIAQQSTQTQTHTDKKASTKGEKKSMTSKHTPADTKKPNATTADTKAK